MAGQYYVSFIDPETGARMYLANNDAELNMAQIFPWRCAAERACCAYTVRCEDEGLAIPRYEIHKIGDGGIGCR